MRNPRARYRSLRVEPLERRTLLAVYPLTLSPGVSAYDGILQEQEDVAQYEITVGVNGRLAARADLPPSGNLDAFLARISQCAV